MRKLLYFVFAVLLPLQFVATLVAQGAPPQGGADQPYTVEYYYKVQWGHQQEFLDLLGATNLIPGPNSTELAIQIGRMRAGWPGNWDPNCLPAEQGSRPIPS